MAKLPENLTYLSVVIVARETVFTTTLNVSCSEVLMGACIFEEVD